MTKTIFGYVLFAIILYFVVIALVITRLSEWTVKLLRGLEEQTWKNMRHLRDLNENL